MRDPPPIRVIVLSSHSITGIEMKRIALALLMIAFAGSAYAADTMSCKPEKKLSGAALTSSVTSCCKKQAAAKKYQGIVKTQFLKKCEDEGMAP